MMIWILPSLAAFSLYFDLRIQKMEDQEQPIHFNLMGMNFPIYKKLMIKLIFMVWISLLLLLSISMYFFGYEMTSADIPGGAISGILLAYLISLLIK